MTMSLMLKHLARRKLRTVCTGLAVLVTFMLIAALLSINGGFTRGVDLTGADRLVVSQKTSFTQPLPLAYGARLLSIPGISSVTYAGYFHGFYRDPSNQFIQLAVDPDNWFALYGDHWSIPPEQLARWKADREGAIVGIDLARRYGWKLGDRVPLRSSVQQRSGGNVWDFTVDGIYRAAASARGANLSMMFFQFPYLNEGRALGQDLVDTYRVRVADPSEANDVAHRIDATFANSAYETTTTTENAFVQAIGQQVGAIGVLVTAILTPLVFTLLLICVNTMSQSVRERTGELGLLKAIGFTDAQLLRDVLLESIALSVPAGIAGLFVWSLIQRSDPTGGAVPMVPLSTATSLAVVASSVVLGAAAGILPAWRASRLSVTQSLQRVRT